MNIARPKKKLNRQYHSGLRVTLTCAVILLILSSLLVDGGQALQFVAASTVVYFTGSAMIVCRRPDTPTWVDLVWVRTGFFAMLICMPFFLSVGWKVRGY